MSSPALDTAQLAATPAQTEVEALVQRARAGERKAQHQLYQRYNAAMYNIALRMVNDPDQAHDVLQEAFVNAFRYLEGFKGDATFGAWLKRIVVNTALHHQKKKRLNVVPLEDYHANRTVDDSPQPGVADDEQSYTVQRVRAAVAQLPEGYRNVLTLYLFEGYDHEEVAGILGISEGTSKSQYNRAKAKLKQLLEGQLP
ncbi:MAG: sigma-70 family RNA polymerase sigma factor [Bacteroidia bacterium]|nr:sigma-70 family RNA polymerase sigma factor [Bacteroidia bacterium]